MHAGKATSSSNVWIKALLCTAILSGLHDACEYHYSASDYGSRDPC